MTWKRFFKYALPLFLLLNLALAGVYRISPLVLNKTLLMMALDELFELLYSQDMVYVREAQRSYLKGDLRPTDLQAQWQDLEKEHTELSLLSYRGAERLPRDVPFVYQTPDQPYLRELSAKFVLPQIGAQPGDEYQAMLKVFRWVGTRFDHGADPVPGGTIPIDPRLVLSGGERGQKYWCEIAAKLTVEVASAFGWPARLVTASRDGYRWEHAVAEIWSNRFNKWFAVDTDFNVIYHSEGVPLSAFELCHQGPELQRQGRLMALRIAPAKKSLKATQLLPFYRYVHIDLRNDWFTRRLRRLSPAGGDQSTWWTARDDVGLLLTGKQRVDDIERFDWKMNQVLISPVGVVQGEGGRALSLALGTYSPYFERFDLEINGKNVVSRNGRISFFPVKGINVVTAKIVDRMGNSGPLSRASFAWSEDGGASDSQGG